MSEQNKNIIDLVTPVIEEFDLELVDLELRGNDRKRVLKIFVYQEGGVTLDKCVTVSRSVAEILERKDPIPGRYVLEVSSPGLDRPLKTTRDFERNKGEKIKVVILAESTEKTGIIESVADDQVFLRDGDTQWDFNIKDLGSAKIIIEF